MENTDIESIKVSANSDIRDVACVIENTLLKRGGLEILVIGAKATNRAMRSVTVATGLLAQNGKEILIRSYFNSVSITDKDGIEQEYKGLRLKLTTKSI